MLLRHPHVWLMTDDMYEHLVYDGFRFTTPVQVEPALKDRTLTVNGVSKAYAMTGWRIGYAGGPKELIRAMGIIQSQSHLQPVLDQPGGGGGGAERRPRLPAGAQRGLQGAPRPGGASCSTRRRASAATGPEGAFYVYPELRRRHRPADAQGCASSATSADFAARLLEDEGVAVVHGTAFGLDPYFRISYATSTELLEEACHRIIRFCEGLAD